MQEEEYLVYLNASQVSKLAAHFGREDEVLNLWEYQVGEMVNQLIDEL